MRSVSLPNVEKANAADRRQARALLAKCELPLDGLEQTELWCVRGSDARVVAVAGLEVWGGQALLRSVAVEGGHRKAGIGSTLVTHLLDTAKTKGTREVFLITETAPIFFGKLGFRKFPRERVKGEVLKSAEFTGACPESAPVMRIEL